MKIDGFLIPLVRHKQSPIPGPSQAAIELPAAAWTDGGTWPPAAVLADNSRNTARVSLQSRPPAAGKSPQVAWRLGCGAAWNGASGCRATESVADENTRTQGCPCAVCDPRCPDWLTDVLRAAGRWFSVGVRRYGFELVSEYGQHHFCAEVCILRFRVPRGLNRVDPGRLGTGWPVTDFSLRQWTGQLQVPNRIAGPCSDVRSGIPLGLAASDRSCAGFGRGYLTGFC